MIKAILYTIGIVAVSLGMATLLVGIFILAGYLPRFAPLNSRMMFCFRLFGFSMPLIILGVGILKLKRWAAGTLSILLLYPAFWCVWSAIYPVAPKAGDANWLGFIFGAVLLCPCILTTKYWNAQIWRNPQVHLKS